MGALTSTNHRYIAPSERTVIKDAIDNYGPSPDKLSDVRLEYSEGEYAGVQETLDSQFVRRTLDVVVSRYGPDYVDQNARGDHAGFSYGCNNVYIDADDQPCARCIAAEVLHEFGVSDTSLLMCNTSGISETIRRLGIPHTKEGISILAIAQRLQDKGMNWGECRDMAITIANV